MWTADALYLKLLVAGTYPLDSAHSIHIVESDLLEMSSAYYEEEVLPGRRPSKKVRRPAPIVIGNPEDDLPAYGEIAELNVQDKALVALVDKSKLNDGFRRGLREGAYPRYCPQFFAPDNPKNPTPGKWLLKHVGFLGPVPQIVRGFLTSEVEFMESLSGSGRTLEPKMRSGVAGLVEFSQFGTKPVTSGDIAFMANAIQRHSLEFEHEISTAKAVQMVMDPAC